MADTDTLTLCLLTHEHDVREVLVDPHPQTAEIASWSASALAEHLAAGDITSVAYVESLIERAQAIDDESSSVALRSIAALSDDAIDQARERDRERRDGQPRGPLHGIPVLVKDNIEAIGLPGAAGSTALTSSGRDAPLVSSLRQAGAIILGSTNLSQWANIRSPRSSSGYSARGGLVVNPWALDRSAGGSSSGSGAAVAAGLAPIAIGTETDGSIVCPSSLNGVVGLKPTVGAISRGGIVPISHSQDSPGPMARTVADIELCTRALMSVSEASDVRIVDATNWRTGHPATDAIINDVVFKLGRNTNITRRKANESSNEVGDDELHVLLAELKDGLDTYLGSRPEATVRSLVEVIDYENQNSGTEMAHFGHEFFERAVKSGGTNTSAYFDARRRNLDWATTTLNDLLEGHSVAIAAAYGPAWKIDLVNGDQVSHSSTSIQATAIAGWPILCIPVGLVDDLPVGLTMFSRPGDEAELLAAAKLVERELEGVEFRPTLRTPTRG